MEWFLVIAFITLIVGIVWVFTISTLGEDGNVGGITLGFLVGWVLVTFIATALFSVHSVDAKEIGVIKTFGRITGQTECHTSANGVQKCGGLTLTAPWQKLQTWNIREQRVVPDEKCETGADHCIDAGDKDQQSVYISPILNLQVSPENVQSLASLIGDDYVNKIVMPRFINAVKLETKNYTATDVHLRREVLENNVKVALQKELDTYSIVVTRVTFANVDYSAKYKAQLDAKSTAIQQALEQENQVAVKEAQARQKVAEAKGEADAAVERARGEAESNRIVAESITQNLIQWESIQKLNPNVSVIQSDNVVPYLNVAPATR